ncbi:hypothetical protein K438DRAFT_1781582 [Mycena galopus ATCC 62051]|nr:hypothetical protein K438DRAFT_1781582 [Mycena galopus ATCC 62051]
MPSFFQVIAVEFIPWSNPCPSYWLHLVLGTGQHREWNTTSQMWHRKPLETNVIQWTSRWLFAIGLQWTPAAKQQTAQATDLHWNSLGHGIGFRHQPEPNSADRPNDSSACINLFAHKPYEPYDGFFRSILGLKLDSEAPASKYH